MLQIEFVPFDEEYLERSWTWLADPEIKRLTDTPDITREGQRKWFAHLATADDYVVWGVLANCVPVGVVGLKHIDVENGTGEYFGYLGEKDHWGKGIGVAMLDFIAKQALERGLNKLCLKVLKENVRAINLYKKYGFCEIDIESHREEFMEYILRETLE